MAFKPNYNLQRADRNRAARARSGKAERVVAIDSAPEDKKA